MGKNGKVVAERYVQSCLAHLQQKTVPGAVGDQADNQESSLTDATRWKNEYGWIPVKVGKGDALFFTRASLSSIHEEEAALWQLPGEVEEEEAPSTPSSRSSPSWPSWPSSPRERCQGKNQSFSGLIPDTCEREQWEKMGWGKSGNDVSKSTLKTRVHKTVSQLLSWSPSVRKAFPKTIVEDLIKQKDEMIASWEKELLAGN